MLLNYCLQMNKISGSIAIGGSLGLVTQQVRNLNKLDTEFATTNQ